MVEAAALGMGAVLARIISDNKLKKRGNKRTRIWSRDWILRRNPQESLYLEFEREDLAKFRQCFRMSPSVFSKLLDMIFPYILKEDTHMRDSIKPNMRLHVTLRYLTSGCNYGVLEELFKIPKQTLSKIVSETCLVIWQVLAPEYIKCPQSSDEWKNIAKRFEVSYCSCIYIFIF